MNNKDYIKDRYARRGDANPEVVKSRLWSELAKTREGPYSLGQRFKRPTFQKPRWTFERFGQSETALPDGRTVWIGGEHEDYYDPDFYIYNDVAVEAGGEFEIFLYDEETFPATDFHTATLVDDTIVLIGSLGYPEQRRYGETQVLVLDTTSWAFLTPPKQDGEMPGWLYQHNATFDGEGIVVSGGFRETEAARSENFDDYRFDVTSGVWQRLTENVYAQYEIRRTDGKANRLWELRQAIWEQEVGWHESFAEKMKKLKSEFGVVRLDTVSSLYTPSFDHAPIDMTGDEYNVYRFEADGVVIRHVEETWTIRVVVEGAWPDDQRDRWIATLVERLAEIEEAPFEAARI